MINKVATADVTWAFGPLGIWSCAEPCLGIVCACLPFMKPILRKFKIIGSSDTSNSQARSYHNTSGRAAYVPASSSSSTHDLKNSTSYAAKADGDDDHLRSPW